MKKYYVAWACVLAVCVGLAGCDNTLHGFGRDMQQAGEKIQGSTHESSTNTSNKN